MRLTKLSAAVFALSLASKALAQNAAGYLEDHGVRQGNGTVVFLFNLASPSLGPFNDQVDLEPPGPLVTSTLSGMLSSNIALGKPGAIDFTDVALVQVSPEEGYVRRVVQEFTLTTVDGLSAAVLPDTNISFGTYSFGYNYFVSVKYEASLPNALVSGRLTLRPAVSSVPEMATWTMMILGFGLIGIVLRGRMLAPFFVKIRIP